MRVRIAAVWEALRASYWFVPTLMSAVAAGLAFLTVTLDEMARQGTFRQLDWVYTGGARRDARAAVHDGRPGGNCRRGALCTVGARGPHAPRTP
jgi:uncharacterized membrane protein